MCRCNCRLSPPHGFTRYRPTEIGSDSSNDYQRYIFRWTVSPLLELKSSVVTPTLEGDTTNPEQYHHDDLIQNRTICHGGPRLCRPVCCLSDRDGDKDDG
ncbi:hypothetical protein PV326_007853 [Microctonus aethiopoides]|nr:hypothetical protein PV326_007853 [Microctonus aethiopoides]